ncbi:MAG: hypothetical protein E7664_01310 [Ruminococcaceae bacterium]|nr:hypothetical protein [Oscillospiraceae bacterium]
MGEEKLEGREIRSESRFAKWFDNYWYHYKWVTIGVLFFAIVFLVCTVQMCGNENEDINVLYTGPYMMTAEERQDFGKVMAAVLPEDYNGNGKKSVSVIDYRVLSQAQVEAFEAETDESGAHRIADRNEISNNHKLYTNYILTGDVAICFLDPSLFASLKETDRLVALSEVLDSPSEAQCDEYGVTLGKTELYEAYGAVRVLPEDTVICFLRATYRGKISKEANYNHEKEMLNAIVGYRSEEE